MSLINETLQQYVDAIDSGFGLISGDVHWLFNLLVMLNVVIAALFWAFSDDQVLVHLIRKVLYVGIFAWIIENWSELTNVFAHTFLLLGLKAGGGQVSIDILQNPGTIAERGLTTVTPIMQAIRDLAGPVGFFQNFPEILLLTLAVLVIIVAFFVIAIQLVISVLTFKLGTLAAFVLVPFSLITHTAFIAERPLGWVVTASVRFMLLTLVVGLGEKIFAEFKIDPQQLTVYGALNIALAALTLMVLSLTASGLAADLASGTPRLDAGDAGHSLRNAGAATAQVTKQTYTVTRKAGGAVGRAAVKAASALHRSKSNAPSDDQPPAGDNGDQKP